MDTCHTNERRTAMAAVRPISRLTASEKFRSEHKAAKVLAFSCREFLLWPAKEDLNKIRSTLSDAA